MPKGSKTSIALKSALWAAAIAAMLVPAATELFAQPQDRDQQNCINRVNKSGSKVAKAQGKATARCLKDASFGNLPGGQTTDQCLTADNKGSVAKAEDKTSEAVADRCGLAPDFGFAGAEAVNEAAIAEEVALASDVFGPDIDAAVIDSSNKVSSRCQQQVHKRYQKIADTKLKEFVKCKKVGLRGGTITGSTGIEDCISILGTGASVKVGKAIVKLTDTVASKCTGVDLSLAFPGSCAGAPAFADCVDVLVECRVCRMLNLMDGLALDCDDFDDGAINGSCDSSIPTTTTSTTSTTTSTTTTTIPPDVCGNGIPETGEDCDDGNTDDGDCCSSTCSFEASGDPCDDGDVCTDNECDGAGACLPVSNNSAPCDDGVFCNGTDTCDAGACTSHAGDPCSGGADCADVCDEGAGSCNTAAGTSCTDDGNVCTNDECDGAGACVHPNNTASCDDGLFCTDTDVCSGGACTGSGDPCAGGADCQTTCDDVADACLDPAGTACTDDGNTCTDDECDGAGACTHPSNTGSCDDGLFCTVTDVCSGGVCTGSGDPCPGADGDSDCSESCNESFDDCTAGDGDGAACDDFQFCNGNDTCLTGACAVHSGDPCDGPDGDGDCTESCDETSDSCTAADPAASPCDDGLFCNGADSCSGGTCSVHPGDPCDGPDGDGDCSETCDEGADDCTGNDPVGLSCNDGSCPTCPDGDSCLDAADCTSGVCSSGTCQVPTCSDSVENGTETDVDCGGSCSGCSTGEGCSSGADCVSQVCGGGTCNAPTCSDGVQNQNETDVDCGGLCGGCGTGENCNGGSDCASGVCGGGTCNAATCSDGVKNQNEGDVDCGGVCAANCNLNQTCNTGGDCKTNFCTGGFCKCQSNLFTFNVGSNSGGVFDSAEWPGGTAAQSTNSECNVTIQRPGGNIDLVCSLSNRFNVNGFSGFGSCAGTGGEDGDGCQVTGCPPAGIGSCCDGRPSCSAALNGSGSSRYFVQCNP